MTLSGKITAQRTSNTAGVVLCGGESRRMGMPKAWLPCGSETMLQRIVHRMAEVLSPIVVVTSANQLLPPLGPQVVVAHDRKHDQGPLEGLAVAFNHVESMADTAMVVACDVPLLRADFVKHLLGCVGEHDAAVPFVDERPHPLVAVYRTRVRETVEQQLRARRMSMRAFLAEIDVRYVDRDALMAVDPSLESLQNINRPEEYRSLARHLGFDVPENLR